MILNPMTGNEVSLYIHVPFCTKKCPYCHFFVQPQNKNLQESFIKALKKEWALRAPLFQGKTLVSIYFGGGTPSLLEPAQIHELVDLFISGPADLSQDCEITLELNPETVTLPKMKQFKEAGINRLSMGVQSFDDKLLSLLGREHSAKRALDAIYDIQRAHFNNLSIDLMYELPNQTLETWEKSLTTIKGLPITHLSLYNLVFEPGTVFYKQKKNLSPLVPDESSCIAMLQLAIETLESYGLSRYEISAFAQSGFESKHNVGYWKARPFIGLGPSAFSFWEGRRFQNICHLNKYIKWIEESKLPEGFEETLEPEKSQKELLAVELRLLCGVNLKTFTQKNGPLSPSLQESIERLQDKGLLEQRDNIVKLTKTGLMLYDSVASDLI